jgi:hypothetical protein
MMPNAVIVNLPDWFIPNLLFGAMKRTPTKPSANHIATIGFMRSEFPRCAATFRGEVWTTKFTVPGFAPGVTELGVKTHDVPLGSPAQAKFVTAKLNGVGLGVTEMV